MKTEGIGAGQLEVQNAFGSRVSGRLGERSVEIGGGQTGRVSRGGLIGAIKSLGSRLLDAITPPDVRVHSKAARAGEALGRGLDRALQALVRGQAEGVRAFSKELLALREYGKALERAGVDYEQVLQQGLRNRLAGLSDEQLQAVVATLHSAPMTGQRNELIDGPPQEVRDMMQALDGLGLGGGPVELDRPDAIRDLSVIESLVLDEAVARAGKHGAEQIDRALERAFGQIARENDGVSGAFAYSLQTTTVVAQQTLTELRQSGALPEGDGKRDRVLTNGLVKERLEALGEDSRAMLLRYASSDQLKQFLEGVSPLGHPTPKTDEAIQAEISQRLARLEGSFGEQVRALMEMPPPPATAAGVFIDALREATDTLKALQTHARTFGLDTSVVDESLPALRGRLDRLDETALALGALQNTEIRTLAASLKLLGVTHLDGAITREIDERVDQAKQAFAGQFDVVMAVAGSGDYVALVKEVAALQREGDHVLAVANELGMRIDDADKISAFRGTLWDETLARYTEDELQAVFARTHTGEFAAAASLFSEAGFSLISEGRLYESVGRRAYDLGTTMAMVDEALGQALAKAGHVVIDVQPDERPPQGAVTALRVSLGLMPTDDGRFVPTGTTLPKPEPGRLDTESSTARLLDLVAGDTLDPNALLEEAFVLNHLFSAGRSEVGNVDADDRQRDKAAMLTGALENCSDLQLANLRDKLRSPIMQNLIEGVNLLRFGTPSNSDPVPEQRLYAIGRLGAAMETLRVLEQVLDEEMVRRGMSIVGGDAPPLELRFPEQINPANRAAIEGAITAIERLDPIRPQQVFDAPVTPGFSDVFRQTYLEPPSGTQREEHKLSVRDGDTERQVGSGVAQSFYFDLGRSELTLVGGGESIPALDRTDFNQLPDDVQGARKQQAIERLVAFCDGDAKVAMGLSRYLNQAGLAPVEVGMQLSGMTLPGTDIPFSALVRHGGQTSYALHKLDDGRYRIDYSVEWGIKAVAGDDGMVPTDPGTSRLGCRFSATLSLEDPDAPEIELGEVRYDLRVERGFTFDVR